MMILLFKRIWTFSGRPWFLKVINQSTPQVEELFPVHTLGFHVSKPGVGSWESQLTSATRHKLIIKAFMDFMS
jgi:hypothetical protein